MPAFQSVYKWLKNGEDKADILDALKEEHPNCDVRAVVLNAMVSIGSATMEPQEFVTGWCIEAAKILYAKMLKTGDFSGALSAVKEVARLNNSHAYHMSKDQYTAAHK